MDENSLFKKQLEKEAAKAAKKDGEAGGDKKDSNDEKTIDEIIREMEEDDDL